MAPAMIDFVEKKSVKEVLEVLDDYGKDQWSGGSFNLLFADSEGNIAYQMSGALPIRKKELPYLGCRILDGRTTDYDWEWGKAAPISDLPRSVNPEKGYIVTANNRQTSDSVTVDHGAQTLSPGRAERITEIIQSKIDAG